METRPNVYEIYVDLRPIDRVHTPNTPANRALWTLSNALVVRGARSVGTTVPLPIKSHAPIRLRRKRSLFERLLRP